MTATIARSEIIMHEVLSDEGGFGVVWRGTCRSLEVAIKVPRNKMSEKQLADFRREVHILSSVFHPNICLFLGACFDGNEIYIVTEMLEGNVERLLRSPDMVLSFYQKVMINVDAARGIAWLHGTGIVHRDMYVEPARVVVVIRLNTSLQKTLQLPVQTTGRLQVPNQGVRLWPVRPGGAVVAREEPQRHALVHGAGSVAVASALGQGGCVQLGADHVGDALREGAVFQH